METETRDEESWQALGALTRNIAVRSGPDGAASGNAMKAPPGTATTDAALAIMSTGHPNASAAAPCLPCPSSWTQGGTFGAGRGRKSPCATRDTDAQGQSPAAEETPKGSKPPGEHGQPSAHHAAGEPADEWTAAGTSEIRPTTYSGAMRNSV